MADTPVNLNALTLAAIEEIDFSKPKWAKEMEKIITRGHTAATIAATAERLGVSTKLFKGLSRAERNDIKTIVKQQLDYLKGFVANAANMSEAQIKARAALYAGAVRDTFSRVRFPGLPFHPADGGTPCKMNCKCSWEQDGNDSYLWTLHPAEHCSGCLDRAAGNPYSIAER